jgi:hypothetical protein
LKYNALKKAVGLRRRVEEFAVANCLASSAVEFDFPRPQL